MFGNEVHSCQGSNLVPYLLLGSSDGAIMWALNVVGVE